MAAMTQVQQGSVTWEEKRDRAIALAGRVADVWDVVIAWGAGVATWVLYLCLILNIVELFWAPALLANGVLVVQSITLDIAGLGLGSMASHAERSGHEKTAKYAKNMSRWLISLMVITVALISAKQIQALQFTFVYITWAETVLVLVRVITTVFYGHVVKSIREVNVSTPAPIPLNQAIDFLKRLEEIEERFKNLSAQTSTTAIENLQEQLKLQSEQIKNLVVEVQQSRALNTLNHPVATFTEPAPVPATSTTLSATTTATEPSSTQVKPRNEPILLHRVQATDTSRTIQAPNTDRAASEAPAASSSKQSFNKTAFVLDCLRENPAMTPTEIKERAAKLNQTISDPIISMARKDFKNQTSSLKAVNE